MVTPASIFEEMAAEGDLLVEDELDVPGLGDISTREARLMADQDSRAGELSETEEVDTDLADGVPKEDITKDAEADISAAEDGSEIKTTFEKALGKTRVGTLQNSQIWLPLTFPPVPKKVSSSSLLSSLLALLIFSRANLMFHDSKKVNIFSLRGC